MPFSFLRRVLSPGGPGGGPWGSLWRHRSVAPVFATLVLWSGVAVTDKLFGFPASPTTIAKGSTVRYTLRAPTDLAWIEHGGAFGREDHFIPIYERNNGLFSERREAI